MCAERLSYKIDIITIALVSNQLHVLDVFFPNMSGAELWMVLRSLSLSVMQTFQLEYSQAFS